MALNLITDVPGLAVGHADRPAPRLGRHRHPVRRAGNGVGRVLGGAPGGRDTGMLEPEMTVEGIDAVVLSGGSAFGLDAPAACRRRCARRGGA